MPKRKGKDRGSKKPPAAMPLRLRKHLAALGMDSDAYLRWCHEHGFAWSLDKTPAEIEREAARFEELSGRNARIDRILQSPHRLIEAACANQINPDELSRLKWASFCRAVMQSPGDPRWRAQLQELLLKVESEADFLFEQIEIGNELHLYVDALIALNGYRKHWLRPLGEWQAAGRSRRRQFSSLLRHLLAHYPVPAFMDGAWFGGDHDGLGIRTRQWFIHLGSGQNLRTAKTPFPLTSRMAHHFLAAPDSYTPAHALRWGEVHALGGDRRLTEALLGTLLAESFAHHEFWRTVILFFVNNPMLDRRHVGPIVDYIQLQKFEVQQVMMAPGVIGDIPPPQPNFTMRGRTPEALLRQVAAWHEETVRARPVHGLTFAIWPIRPLRRKVDGSKDKWVIYQLLSGSELIKEGKTLNHCVATYAESCSKGRSSIWSMERETPTGAEKTLTIEVTRASIVAQVRGNYNRLPTRAEFNVIRFWAAENGLTISDYLMVQG
jgi:hypothetical protein